MSPMSPVARHSPPVGPVSDLPAPCTAGVYCQRCIRFVPPRHPASVSCQRCLRRGPERRLILDAHFGMALDRDPRRSRGSPDGQWRARTARRRANMPAPLPTVGRLARGSGSRFLWFRSERIDIDLATAHVIPCPHDPLLEDREGRRIRIRGQVAKRVAWSWLSSLAQLWWRSRPS